MIFHLDAYNSIRTHTVAFYLSLSIPSIETMKRIIEPREVNLHVDGLNQIPP